MSMHHSTPQDNLDDVLDILTVPEPSAHSVAQLVSYAKEHPRHLPAPLMWLRQLRAFLYLPSSRYVVMACMVGFFIVVGLVGTPAPKADADILGLISFDEEDPLRNFWTAGL